MNKNRHEKTKADLTEEIEINKRRDGDKHEFLI